MPETSDEPYDWADDPDLGSDEILRRFRTLAPARTSAGGGCSYELVVTLPDPDCYQVSGTINQTFTTARLCPDLLRYDQIGVADNWRGRTIRAFFWLMRAWPPTLRRGGIIHSPGQFT